MPGKRIRTRALAAAASLAVVAGLFALAPLTGVASSHREAPLVSADPQIDTTDVWAFVSEDRPDTVTLIASWIPFEEPAGGPNFYAWGDGVRYDLNIDNDHDAKPDLTYRWVFASHYRNPNTFLFNTGPVTSLDDPDLNFYQTYDLIRVNRDTGKQKRLVNDATFGAVQRGRGLDAELQQRSVRRRHGGVRLRAEQDVGGSVGRRVLPRPARVRPAVRGEPDRGR